MSRRSDKNPKPTKNSIRKEALNLSGFRSGKALLASIQWETMSDGVGRALKSLVRGRDALREAYLLHVKANSPEMKHPEMTFALDGRLVGDIGELITATLFPLEILGTKSKSVDANTTVTPIRKVQIKATFGDNGLSIKHGADHFIGLQLGDTGKFRIIYNGPANPVMSYLKAPASKGKRGRTNAGTRLESLTLEAWAVLNLSLSDNQRVSPRKQNGRPI